MLISSLSVGVTKRPDGFHAANLPLDERIDGRKVKIIKDSEVYKDFLGYEYCIIRCHDGKCAIVHKKRIIKTNYTCIIPLHYHGFNGFYGVYHIDYTPYNRIIDANLNVIYDPGPCTAHILSTGVCFYCFYGPDRFFRYDGTVEDIQ